MKQSLFFFINILFVCFFFMLPFVLCSNHGVYKVQFAILSSVPTFLDCTDPYVMNIRVGESPSHACIIPFRMFFFYVGMMYSLQHIESDLCLCIFNRWRTSWARRSCSSSFPRIWVLVRVQSSSLCQSIIWTNLKTRLGYLPKSWNRFSVAASSGGSVEGYCAGEKEVIDAFNKWVRRSSHSLLGGCGWVLTKLVGFFFLFVVVQLGEQLLRSVPTSGVDVVELEDEGTCVRFSPLLTAAGNKNNWHDHSFTFCFVFSYIKALNVPDYLSSSCFSSVGNAAGGCWEAGGEAFWSPASDEFHNVPQAGLQGGGPPVQPLSHVRGRPQLARPRRCSVSL